MPSEFTYTPGFYQIQVTGSLQLYAPVFSREVNVVLQSFSCGDFFVESDLESELLVGFEYDQGEPLVPIQIPVL